MKKEKICLNRKVKTILKKVELKTDCLVPDIKPDIVNIINTNGMAYLIKEQVENGKVKIDGNVDTYIIYLSDIGENRSISTTVNFFEVIEDERITEDACIDVKSMIINIESKILNERKVSLTIYMILKIEISEENELEYIGELENNDFQKLERNLNVKNILYRNKVQNSIKDVLRIEDDSKITEIFKADIEVKSKETKMSFNKLLAKAEIEIKILYLDENSKVKMVTGEFPLMTFIELKDTKENSLSELDYIVRNVFFKIQNEGNLIEFQIDFEIKNLMYEEKKLNVIEDIYSLTKVLDIESKNVNLRCIKDEENLKEDIVGINESFRIDNISNLLGYEIKFNLINRNKNNGIYNYESEMNLICFYEVNNEKNIKSSLIKIPFLYKSTIDEEYIEFLIKNCSIKLNGENINVSVELECDIDKNKCVNLNIVTDIKEKEDINIDDYNFIVYFVKEGDTLWNIAKKFNACMNDLIDINKLDNPNKLNIGDKIYIMK